jgi:O-antigen ligase
VATTLVICFYFAYLFSTYSVRQSTQRDVRTAAGASRFGAATAIAVFFLAWSGLSFLWTPARATSVIIYLNYLVQVLISYLLCKLYPIRSVFRNACKGTAYAAAALIPMAILLTGYSGGRLGASDQLTLFSMIAFAACQGVFAVAYLVQARAVSKFIATFLMISLLVGLYLTFGKTEIVALTVAGIAYFLLAPGSILQRMVRVVLMVIGLVSVFLTAASRVAEYMNATASMDTLTGRTVLWVQTYAQIVNGPWIRGFGILSFREIGPVPWHGLDFVVHAHNEFLTVWFNYGLVGVVLVFGSYFALGIDSFRYLRRKGGTVAVLVLCSVIFCLVRGGGEAHAAFCVLPIPWLLLLDCMVATQLQVGRDSAAERSRLRRF